MSLQGKKILALVPARGGSKGLPRKNVLPFNGKPLIVWIIEAAKSSRYVDRVVVSTEDREIAELARQAGAELPFERPKELATDSAAMMEVVVHAMKHFDTKKEHFDILVLLQPTSPLRTTDHIDGALEFFEKRQARAVVSVTEAEHPPEWINQLPEDLNMKDFLRREARSQNRQALGKYYRLNGSIFIAEWSFLKDRQDWFSERTFAYIMDQRHSVDIDSQTDFVLAETIMNLTDNSPLPRWEGTKGRVQSLRK